MEYTYPDYYKDFKCSADKCPDTCCAGWQIVIDRKTLQKYREYPGAFGSRLHNSIDWEESSFKQYDKRCAFLNEENLCDICLEAGEDKLCKTCRRYPRHYEEFENLREISLSLSCPEAAKLILERDKKVTFQTVERDNGLDEEYEYFDFLLHTKLQEIRLYLLELFQNRKLPLPDRMAMALTSIHDLQTRIGSQKLFEIDDLLEKYKKPETLAYGRKKWEQYRKRSDIRSYLMHSMMYRLYQLEPLKDDWRDWLKDCETILYEKISPYEYQGYCQQFDKNQCDELYQYEQLLVYFLFSYFCGAVYDSDAMSKIKLIIVHTMLIRELHLAVWIKNGKRLSLSEKTDIAHRYAREVEHSDVNLRRMEHMVHEDPFFDMGHLLVCILG